MAMMPSNCPGGPTSRADGVADSKMLTEHRREAIFDELRDWCAAYAVGQASNTEIDEWGITYALGVAALRALSQVERELGLRLGGESTIKKGFGESAGKIVEGRPGGSVGESIGNCEGSVRALPKVAGILDGPSDYITKRSTRSTRRTCRFQPT